MAGTPRSIRLAGGGAAVVAALLVSRVYAGDVAPQAASHVYLGPTILVTKDGMGFALEFGGETPGGLLLKGSLGAAGGGQTLLYATASGGFVFSRDDLAPYVAAGLGVMGYGDYEFAEPQYKLWRSGFVFTPEVGLILFHRGRLGRLTASVQGMVPLAMTLERGDFVRDKQLDASPWILLALKLSI